MDHQSGTGTPRMVSNIAAHWHAHACICIRARACKPDAAPKAFRPPQECVGKLGRVQIVSVTVPRGRRWDLQADVKRLWSDFCQGLGDVRRGAWWLGRRALPPRDWELADKDDIRPMRPRSVRKILGHAAQALPPRGNNGRSLPTSALVLGQRKQIRS